MLLETSNEPSASPRSGKPPIEHTEQITAQRTHSWAHRFRDALDERLDVRVQVSGGGAWVAA